MASDELEMHLRRLAEPCGGEPDLRQRRQAVEYLLAHPEEAHARVMEALEANPAALDAPALIEVLPLFARPESVPLLEDILFRNLELHSGAAGVALGRHPDPGARGALLRGLQSGLPHTLMAAIDGLMIRGDASVCAGIKAVTKHPDADTRYHAIRAAGALGCLSEDEIRQFERTDSDPDIRALARALASGQQ
jgi:hypothetical protein